MSGDLISALAAGPADAALVEEAASAMNAAVVVGGDGAAVVALGDKLLKAAFATEDAARRANEAVLVGVAHAAGRIDDDLLPLEKWLITVFSASSKLYEVGAREDAKAGVEAWRSALRVGDSVDTLCRGGGWVSATVVEVSATQGVRIQVRAAGLLECLSSHERARGRSSSDVRYPLTSGSA